MLFRDFFAFFYSATVSYTDNDFHHVRIAEEIEDEEWGCCQIKVPERLDTAFISLYQMNQKFFDQEDMELDVLTTQQIDPNKDSMAEMLLKQNVTDAVVDKMMARNAESAFEDFGTGPLLPEMND